MKIEIEERELDTLPNDIDLGKYVRFKMNEAKNASNINKPEIKINWVKTTTVDGNIEWHPDSNKI